MEQQPKIPKVKVHGSIQSIADWFIPHSTACNFHWVCSHIFNRLPFLLVSSYILLLSLTLHGETISCSHMFFVTRISFISVVIISSIFLVQISNVSKQNKFVFHIFFIVISGSTFLHALFGDLYYLTFPSYQYFLSSVSSMNLSGTLSSFSGRARFAQLGNSPLRFIVVVYVTLGLESDLNQTSSTKIWSFSGSESIL